MNKEHNFDVKVYYEDTDSGGIVYYANYLKFTERARTEMIYDRLGLSHGDLKNDHDCIFIVSFCKIRYIKPAKFEDKLLVQTSVLKKSPVRLNLLQVIKKKSETLISSEVELAVVSSSGKVQKLPKELLSKI